MTTLYNRDHPTVDREEIFRDTQKAFMSNPAQVLHYNDLPHRIGQVPEQQYNELYNKPLVPTSIKIDVELFNHEIQRYDNWFEQWGRTFDHLPRKAVALVNQDGQLKQHDPVNRSLYEYNQDHPDEPLADCDVIKPTEILDLPSLNPLSILDPYWCRSNVLRWEKGGKFVPHIDCVRHRIHWLRLWGTTTNDIRLRFDTSGTGELIEHEDVECGRIYLIDTALIHDARCINNMGYQFFLAVLPQAYPLLTDLVLD